VGVYALIENDLVIGNAVIVDAIKAAAIVASIGIDRAEDCTGYDPRPTIGWSWPPGGPPEYGSPPQEPQPRVISSLTLAQRFTDAEFEGLANHTATAAKAFVARLQMCGNIWLDDPRLAAALAKMVTAGILTSNRPAEILA